MTCFLHGKKYAEMLNFNTLATYFLLFHLSCIMQNLNKQNSRFVPRKRGLSHHHAMHHFHTITPIMLLFQELRPEKKVNHAIKSCITFKPSRQLFCCLTNHVLNNNNNKKILANHAITPTAKAVSLKCLLLHNHLKNTFKRIFKYLL